MSDVGKVVIDLVPVSEFPSDLDEVIYDLDRQIDYLTSKSDNLDYLVAVASGVLCGLLDVLWVGDFSLERGRGIASNKVEDFVKFVAKRNGWEDDGNIRSAVKFLQDLAPLASDGNTPDFGGGLQHHLRDFAHHPTIVGLIFSLLTQFTGKSYGTDVNGVFKVADVKESSFQHIGKDVPEKIFFGTTIWFLHLVSDMAGTDKTAGLSGGTGIPGPLLSFAKELSALPIFRQMKIDGIPISTFISKLFNGTIFAKRDEQGKIIKESILKMDLRGELGIGHELSRQAIPVIANECIVRTFYFIRKLSMELAEIKPKTFSDIESIEWKNVVPSNNPTISRMLTIATAVFTTVDVTDALVSHDLLLSVNYVGVGRFAMALGTDVKWQLKKRQIKAIRDMYATIRRNTFTKDDNRMYGKMLKDFDLERFALTVEQTEILYNIECFKVRNDIKVTDVIVRRQYTKDLKQEWLNEWKHYMEVNFAKFIGIPGAKLHWFKKKELLQKIEENDPSGTWFRLVLLEAMIFEPYFPLTTVKDKKGKSVLSKKYQELQIPMYGYYESDGDKYLTKRICYDWCPPNYIERLRKCYKRCQWELNEVLKSAIKFISITAVITLITTFTAGTFTANIAVFLVGSNFPGLHGAALAAACLAYLGGGAVAAGGAGMAGGTMVIVGGGAALGLGVGGSLGGLVGFAGLNGKQGTIKESAKLMTAVREIFLNDEHDVKFSDSVLEQYTAQYIALQKSLVELKANLDTASKKKKKKLQAQIKQIEGSIDAMHIAQKSMRRFISSYKEGIKHK